MEWISYRRPGAIGMTRVPLTRGRRRVLLALLSGASNLTLWRLGETAQVGEVRLCSFLDHLEKAGWTDRHRRKVGLQTMYCYSLTDHGRLAAQADLRLLLPVPLDAVRE
jgi:hypothetical protein